MSITILDHGARRKRAELRRTIGNHFVTGQLAKAAKRKGLPLTSGERRDVSERAQEALEKRQFHKDH